MRLLNEQEKKMIWIALGMRTNYIETSNIAVAAVDATKYKELPKDVTINALSDDQMRLILASRGLVTKVLQDKVFIED